MQRQEWRNPASALRNRNTIGGELSECRGLGTDQPRWVGGRNRPEARELPRSCSRHRSERPAWPEVSEVANYSCNVKQTCIIQKRTQDRQKRQSAVLLDVAIPFPVPLYFLCLAPHCSAAQSRTRQPFCQCIWHSALPTRGFCHAAPSLAWALLSALHSWWLSICPTVWI